MAVHTRKANATTHPGDILLRNKQPRRTRQQIEADDARATAAAKATREQVAANHSAVLDRIAELEDSVAEEDVALRMQSNRPDLFQPREPEELEEIVGEEQDLQAHTLSSPQSTDTPDESGSESISENSMPNKERGDATEVDSDEDMSAESARPKRKRVEKKKRGSLRAEVNLMQNVVNLPSSKKRKAPQDTSVRHPRPLKRCNAMDGLHSNWRAQAQRGAVGDDLASQPPNGSYLHDELLYKKSLNLVADLGLEPKRKGYDVIRESS
ncbi:hypothetical protein F5888DRAFT_1809866 [Russula emetica]|nr:hypothetical protein F5888DRAFT_1809866 [Russula emetica]